MYGGLFGDLPAAKNDSGSSSQDQKNNDDGKGAEKKDILALTQDEDSDSRKKGDTDASSKTVKNPSVLKSLGVAGTSMAFVPSHLKRKRNTAINKNTTTAPQLSKPSALPISSIGNDSSTNQVKVPAVAMDLATTWKEETHPKPGSQQETHIHDPHAPATTTQSLSQQSLISASTGGEYAGSTTYPISGESQQQAVAVEPEALRRLHESVTEETAYDPFVPNDLLQYWERQAAVQERKELEREAKEAMEAQARMRKQLELERQKLEEAGDVNKLAEHQENRARIISSEGGRGRGRGVSNLPKWLVDKQKKEAEMRNMPERKE